MMQICICSFNPSQTCIYQIVISLLTDFEVVVIDATIAVVFVVIAAVVVEELSSLRC